jgi:hypothetical protein
MTTYAVMAWFYLTDAAPDTAGDVGAVHHVISPEACGISRSGLWFFSRPTQPCRPRPAHGGMHIDRNALARLPWRLPPRTLGTSPQEQ